MEWHIPATDYTCRQATVLLLIQFHRNISSYSGNTDELSLSRLHTSYIAVTFRKPVFSNVGWYQLDEETYRTPAVRE
jgi:hypothetical protein